MFHTRGTHGFTLHPDRAYLEVEVKLHNRTSTPQTFLWWANPAVHVHDETQSIFPPDVHAVMDHGKRDVSDFPIATGVYYKVNYFPGTDISRYRNIPVPTSYMAYRSDYDFIGNYDYRLRGMLHVANHHVVPGKKQWTWGNGDFGRAWDRQLTDEDGPYIELMCGAYTDNQPDFSWIMPGEEKSFKQYFLPYKQIGAVKNATREIALNLEVEGSLVRIGIYATRPREMTARLEAASKVVFERSLRLSPEKAFDERVALPSIPPKRDLRLSVWDGDQLLVEYASKSGNLPIPLPPALAAAEIASNELFLNGLHLEQYRHATFAAKPYYEEALRRDPFDSRCNNAIGLLLYRQGMFGQAEMHFRKAIRRLTGRNPNPYDGEAYYNLGLALKMQGRHAEAYDSFYKSTLESWQDAGYLGWRGWNAAKGSTRRPSHPSSALFPVIHAASRPGI
jgi:tetratricopeptide (TPR) repeat protein